MADPLLTVILPAHNAEATIAAAIQSVLQQSYAAFELWILENGSSDRTVEIAESFSDPRVKVFQLGPVGFQGALEYALKNAKTEWLARMDADDVSFPERFREQVKVIKQQPEIVLVGTRCVYLTPFGHIFETRPNAASREIGALNLRLPGDEARFFVDGSVIFRRSIALEVGGYDPEFQMGDVPLWFRMLSQGKGWEIAKPLYLYRLHPSSLSYAEFAASDQSYRFLVKYAPQLLHLYYSEDSTQHPKSDPWPLERYWLRIAAYEALTGDRRSVLQAVDFLKRDGPFQKEARLISWFSSLGHLGSIPYRWYRRNKYRHRPDLEKFLTTLVGQLALEQEVHAG
jgi:glycosyltransferase involved in cell wall biosynthesis